MRRDTQTLQKLWGEEPAVPDYDINNDQDHASRVRAMQQQSGLEFAANPHEFMRHSGLPKYGNELSDDDEGLNDDYRIESTYANTINENSNTMIEHEMEVEGGDEGSLEAIQHARQVYEIRMNQQQLTGHWDMRYVTSKPPLDSVAYDSEYDEDEDD